MYVFPTTADIVERVRRSETDPPILLSTQDIVDEWALVPRRHLRALTQLDLSDIGSEKIIVAICAEIVADARLLGRADDV